MKACNFCQILDGASEASFVYRDDNVSAFMDMNPVNPGHVLVVPNRHATYLADLPPEAGGYLFRTAQVIAAGIRRSAHRCEGINFFLADGEAAMQEELHVHLHVFPRYRGDGFDLVVGEHYHERPSRSELDLAAETIREGIALGVRPQPRTL